MKCSEVRLTSIRLCPMMPICATNVYTDFSPFIIPMTVNAVG